MTKEKNKQQYHCCDEKYWEKKYGEGFEKKIESFFENLGKHHLVKCHSDHGMGGGFYFLAMIGAAVYNVQQVSGFWPTIAAILKAIVWPAFLLYEVYVRLGM